MNTFGERIKATTCCNHTDDQSGPQRRKPRDVLKTYYGMSEDGAGSSVAGSASGPCDINGAAFEPDVYLSRLLKERSLTELMDKESEMVKHIKLLDSDMQTLVYENYNKFISATDTIRKVSISVSPYGRSAFQSVHRIPTFIYHA